MKKILSFVLSIALLCVFFASIHSCAKPDANEVGGTNASAKKTEIGNTSISATKEVYSGCFFPVKDPLYDKYNPINFIDYWKEQQKSDDPETRGWRALDGSPETLLLYPKVKKSEYSFSSCEIGNDRWFSIEPNTREWKNREKSFICYVYNYFWGGDDWTEATMNFIIYKGNPLQEIFLKDELTYDDLKYFVETFKWDESDKEKFGELEYVDDMILMRDEYRVICYFIHAGQIVEVRTTDDLFISSPEKLFDYITFEEITLD